MQTPFDLRTRRIAGNTRIKPWTKKDRRSWRIDPDLATGNAD